MRARSTSAARAGFIWAIAVLAFVGPASALQAAPSRSSSPARLHYRIDAGKSRMVIATHTTGLSSMFGHDHEIAAREFTGSISFIPGAPETASLDVTVQVGSLALLDKDVSAGDRRDIERTIRKSLDAAKYKQISFHGAGATAEAIGPNVYEVQVSGELRLHGVRNELAMPAQVIVQDDGLRVRGSCKIRQSEYRIALVSFANGTVGISDEVTLSFDLVAPAARSRGGTAPNP